jgi:NodT family efflux transporter outer membrane factor (OMF) lipoprotein
MANVNSLAPVRPKTEKHCRLRYGVVVAVTIGLLQACTAVGPDYQSPQTRLPDLWHQDLTKGLKDGKTDLREWWTRLQDPMLNNLIARAGAGNLDLKQAVARILEARANVGIAAGAELPQVGAGGQIETGRVSEGVAGKVKNPPRKQSSTLYSTGLDATWELDLWGRISRQVESADAGLQASVEDYRDVLVSLYAEVAQRYVDVRTAQARIQALVENVESQKKTLRLVQDRLRAELASDLEVAQAELNLATTESQVPTVRQDLAAAVHRLGVLLGERPTALYAELRETKPIPQPPKEILVGLPTELLRQRPDIRAAERRLAAQTAQIGVATADLYPRFSLTGFFAFENFGVSDVFKWQNRAYGLGPTMQWNVFDGGRIRSNIQAQDAITQQLLTSYEQTVLDALRQVEDAMAFYIQENDRQDALYRSVVAAAKSVKLVQTLYVTGLTDFQNVQDQERRKSEQDDQYAQSQGAVTKYLVDIYRSLGGGWAPTDQQPTTTGAEAPKSDKGTTASTPAPQANEGIVHVSADASRDAPRRR